MTRPKKLDFTPGRRLRVKSAGDPIWQLAFGPAPFTPGQLVEVVGESPSGNVVLATDAAHTPPLIPADRSWAENCLTYVRGRPMFPGEAPPPKGAKYGVTGVNNDYRKLGKLQPKVAPLTQGGTVAPSPADTKVSAVQTSLTGPQNAAIGQTCPVCKTGHFAAKTFTVAKTNQSGVLVGCTNFPRCRTSIAGNGDITNAQKIGGPRTVVGSFGPAAPTVAEVNTDGIIVSDPAAAGVTQEPVTPAAPADPLAEALTGIGKIRDDIRALHSKSEVSINFGFRVWQFWLKLSHSFMARGAKAEDALDRAFVMAYLDKLNDEEREPVRTLYHSVFARYPDRSIATKVFTVANILRMCYEERIPLWTYGPAGCGKTRGFLDLFRSLNVSPVRFQGTKQATVDELAGAPGLQGGTSVEVPGIVEIAVTSDRPLIVDEIDHLPGAVTDELRAMLEDMDDDVRGGRYTNRRTGATIDISQTQYFWVCATANTGGTGDTGGYVGAMAVNTALRDRFVFLRMGFPTPSDEKKMMEAYKASLKGRGKLAERPADYDPAIAAEAAALAAQ